MIYYFDTSALLKRYLLEEGTNEVLSLFRKNEVIPVTSLLTQVEGFHGICRKWNEAKASIKLRQQVLRQFQRDMQTFQIVTVDSALIKISKKLVQNHLLRSLDAIHIASALVFKKRGNEKIHFVSCDNLQNKVAQQQGLLTLNPVQ